MHLDDKCIPFLNLQVLVLFWVVSFLQRRNPFNQKSPRKINPIRHIQQHEQIIRQYIPALRLPYDAEKKTAHNGNQRDEACDILPAPLPQNRNKEQKSEIDDALISVRETD
jgi:hypothetical protein